MPEKVIYDGSRSGDNAGRNRKRTRDRLAEKLIGLSQDSLTFELQVISETEKVCVRKANSGSH